MKGNHLTIALGTSQHTYGDAVKGAVILDNNESLFISVLEMTFIGTCGTTFNATASNGIPQRLSEEKTLFSHQQTLISERDAGDGVHKFAFEFRFPHQDEVLLSPNTVPSDGAERFYFKYQLSAKMRVVTEDGFSTTIESGPKEPKFSGSRPSGWPLRETSMNMDTTLKSKWSKSSIVKRRSEMTNIVSFKTFDKIVTGDLIPLDIGINTQQDATLEALTLSLKSRVKLMAHGQHKHLELDHNLPLRLANFSANKRQKAPVIKAGQSTSVAQQLELRCPSFLRATFFNELINFEYVLSIRAEFDIGGKAYTAKLDSIPVKVTPHALSSEVDCFDYASNPPAVLPALDDDDLYSPPNTAPSTPPPEWTPFPDDEIERRFRQNSVEASGAQPDASYFALFPCQ